MPELEPILKDTYGMIVYQEQVMQITAVGGFSLGQSDMLRRAMGKKKKDVMDQMKDEFLAGAKKKSLNVDIAEKSLTYVISLLNMGLINRIVRRMHYVVSTAYLKTHYPNEYLLGLLLSALGNTDRTAVYVAEAKRLGINVIAPDVNCSNYLHEFNGTILFLGWVVL